MTGDETGKFDELIAAVTEGDIQRVGELLDDGVGVNSSNERGETSFSYRAPTTNLTWQNFCTLAVPKSTQSILAVALLSTGPYATLPRNFAIGLSASALTDTTKRTIRGNTHHPTATLDQRRAKEAEMSAQSPTMTWVLGDLPFEVRRRQSDCPSQIGCQA
jgi:hypothetical protein